jgi:hypothetical protein
MQAIARDLVGPLVVACAVTMLIVGCVPIPRTVNATPSLVGTLQRFDGTPVGGERLTLSLGSDTTCVDPVLSTTTDARGNFEFAAIRKREPVTPVLFERQFCFNICGHQAMNFRYQSCFLHRVPAKASYKCVELIDNTGETGSRVLCTFRARRRS